MDDDIIPGTDCLKTITVYKLNGIIRNGRIAQNNAKKLSKKPREITTEVRVY